MVIAGPSNAIPIYMETNQAISDALAAVHTIRKLIVKHLRLNDMETVQALLIAEANAVTTLEALSVQ